MSGSREPKAGMVAEGGLWRRGGPCFPEGNRGLFVKMKNQNLKKECRACGCTTTGRSTLGILRVGFVGGGAGTEKKNISITKMDLFPVMKCFRHNEIMIFP